MNELIAEVICMGGPVHVLASHEIQIDCLEGPEWVWYERAASEFARRSVSMPSLMGGVRRFHAPGGSRYFLPDVLSLLEHLAAEHVEEALSG